MYVDAGITELLTKQGPLVGAWLDGAGIPVSGDRSRFCCPELHTLIRGLQPQAPRAFKRCIEGSEDFLVPERPQLQNVTDRRGRHMEVCWTTQKRGWGWKERAARRLNANLLSNMGPLGDGSIHPAQEKFLCAMVRRLRAGGFPQQRPASFPPIPLRWDAGRAPAPTS